MALSTLFSPRGRHSLNIQVVQLTMALYTISMPCFCSIWRAASTCPGGQPSRMSGPAATAEAVSLAAQHA